MTSRDMLLESTDWLRVRLGFRPRCGWVQDRLGEYFNWELCQIEFKAIERHLSQCSECAQAWRDTERVLEEIVALSPIGQELKSISTKQFMAEMWAKINAHEAEKARQEAGRKQSAEARKAALRSLGRMPRLAAALLSLLCISALAYLGPQVWRQVSERWMQKEAATQDTGQTVSPKAKVIVSSKSERPENSKANQPAQTGRPIAQNQNFAQQLLLGADLNKQIEVMTADAHVQLLLPHTEAQWEAWARKEYPHIMWVYDVLTKPEYGINWDGKPVNIPDWAKKVWTDEPTWPTGWRALVCYSGEILKFDFPNNIEAPNVMPSIQAMKVASVIAGYNFHFDKTGRDVIPTLDYADLELNNQINKATLTLIGMPIGDSDWVTIVSLRDKVPFIDKRFVSKNSYFVLADQQRTIQTLIYIATSTSLIPAKPWREPEGDSAGLLVSIENSGWTPCNRDALRAKFQAILAQHQQLAVKTIRELMGEIRN